MGFLTALAATLIEKVLAWIGTLLVKKVQEEKQIMDDNARADENSKKVDQAKTDEERRKANENLFNGN